MDKVSIIIPCYNQAKYLPDAIESAMMQTYKNTEIIVVNDGSTDNTAEVAGSYPVILINQVYRGLAGARNKGIETASGQWILPLDSDDMILPDYIEKTIGKADFVTVDIQEFGNSNRIWRLGNNFTVEAFKASNRAVCCSLYRKEVWQLIGGYDENMRVGYEDWDFNLRCADAGFSMTRVPEALFLYRKHGRSMVDEATDHHEEIRDYMLKKLASIPKVKAKGIKITYWLRDDGACGYYRATLPLQTMRKNDSDIKLKQITQGMHVDKITNAMDADIQLIPRPADERIAELMIELKKDGRKFIVDHDDDVFNISPTSPHYVNYGIEEVKVPINGKLVDLWIDGKNINIKANKLRRDAVIKSVEAADLITVTTEILANTYRQYNDAVMVLPNCIDLSLWQKLPIKNDNIRLFWSGGHSHYEDWYEVKDAIRIVMNKYPQCKLVLMGFKWDATLQGINPEQIEYHEWVATPAYPYKSAILNPDIAIIPLRDTEFNRCKSPIKWIEQSALSVPSVVSHVSPYADIATEHNGVFIENNDTGAWVSGLSMLIEDSILRAKIGGEANRYVRQNFDINRRWVDWKIAYEGVLNGKSICSYT